MSGDVQPKKRKDKKKRKEDVDQIPEKPCVPIFANNALNNEDINIHVHKEEGTGGGICAKLVFFILFSALAVLIGLIITEHRGLTDLETINPNSKFSQLFEGWVDTKNQDDHDDHDIEALEDEDNDEDHEDDHNENNYEEDDNDDEHDDDDEETEEVENSQEVEDDEDDDQLESVEENNDEEEIDDQNGESDEVDDDSEEANKNEDQSQEYETEETKDVSASEEDNINQDEDDNQQYQDDDDTNTEQADDEDEANNEDIEEKDEQNIQDTDEDEVKTSQEKRYMSEEKVNNKGDNDRKEQDDEDKYENQVTEKKEKGNGSEDDTKTSENNNENDTEDVVIKEQKKDKSKNIKTKIQDEAKTEEKVQESSGMAVKIGVGVALLVVAHLVLVKKWRNAEDNSLPDEKPPASIQDRRNTIIVPPTFKEVEPDIEQVPEDFSDEDEDEENNEKITELNSAKVKYEELTTAYTRPDKSDRVREYEDDEYEELDEEQIEEEEISEEYDDEEEEGEDFDDEVDDEDEELLKRLEARYGKLHKDSEVRLREPRESDSDNDYDTITNNDDNKIKKEIDEAHSSIANNTSHAIALFDKILQKFPSSPRSLYGKALAMDLLADQKRSNEILEKAIQLYLKLLKTDKVPEKLYHLTAERCINRMRFLGQYKNAIIVHKIIINKFPSNPKHLNSLAVTYLTINRIEEARAVLKGILAKWPKNGFALVHYGFILKTIDNDLEKAVRYLTKGINTKDDGVIDGRFYFHLGDALVRLGKNFEANKVYEEGTKNKLFLSKYQRSLYNVPRLSSKPWWKAKDIQYSKSLNLLATSWKQIRDEGLSILSEKGYFQDESENLRDTGEWKQFELYARGQKNVLNCKKCPFTCSIINQIPEAKTCRRGQTKFSVMHAGTHIWPHCGPTNCRLRIHLGLKIPPNTFMRVADDTKSWREGEIFIFDDSFEHEVWHNGTEFRLILIVDVWHPELTLSERNSLSPI